MLQHNVSAREAPLAANNAHWAHAAVVGLHAVCCGAPAAISLLSLGAAGVFGVVIYEAHHLLHAHELWLLAVSGFLVSLGGVLEWRAWRAGRITRLSWFYIASVALFFLNAAIVISHRV